MDSVYSGSLALSMAAAAMALVLGLTGKHFRVGATSALVAIGLLAVSMFTHFTFGHRPGTDQALGFPTFFVEHPAFVVVGLAELVMFRTLGRHARKISPTPSRSTGSRIR